MPSPLVGTGIAVGSQFLNRALARKDRIREKKYALELDKYTRAKDLEQWNRQNKYNREMWDLRNAYNTPQAQMDRFKQAGLNPHLIYGKGESGQASPVTSAELSKYSAPQGNYKPTPIDLTNMLGMYYDLRQKKAVADITTYKADREAWLNENIILYDHSEGEDKATVTKTKRYRQLWNTMLDKYKGQATGSQADATLKSIEAEIWDKIQTQSGQSKGSIGMLMNMLKLLLGRR